MKLGLLNVWPSHVVKKLRRPATAGGKSIEDFEAASDLVANLCRFGCKKVEAF